MKPVFRIAISVITAIALLSADAHARSPQTDELDAILRDARAAVGSESDLAKIRSISVTADCIGPKGKYTTSIDSFRGSKTRFGQTFTYKSTTSNLFINGETAWTVDASTGNASISSPFERMAARAHEYQKMAYAISSFFTGLEIVGSTDFEGSPSIKVRAKNELGMAASLYFDKETKRFSGYVLEIPNSTETIKNAFLEWRRFGRLTLPVVVRATDKEGDWTLRFSTITFNKANEKLLDVPPRVADMTELLRMHEVQKTAHLTYDAELLLGDSPETPISVQRGNVIKRTREEDLARFKAYFSSFKFLEWEDIVPPVIKISNDGTMATKIVRKRVRGITRNAEGKEVIEHTVFAWLEVLEKIQGKWRLTAIASTEKPGDK